MALGVAKDFDVLYSKADALRPSLCDLASEPITRIYSLATNSRPPERGCSNTAGLARLRLQRNRITIATAKTPTDTVSAVTATMALTT